MFVSPHSPSSSILVPSFLVQLQPAALRDYRLFFLGARRRAARAARAPRKRSISFSLLDSPLRCTNRAPSSSPSAESRLSLRCNCLFLSTPSPCPFLIPSVSAAFVLLHALRGVRSSCCTYTLHIERLFFSPSASRVYPASPPLPFYFPSLVSFQPPSLYLCADSVLLSLYSL